MKKYGCNEFDPKVKILHALAADISHLQANPMQRPHPGKQSRQMIYSVSANSPQQRHKAVLKKKD